MTAGIETLSFDALTVHLDDADDTLRVRFVGKSGARSPGAFFARCTTTIVAAAAGRPVRLDFGPLTYINSAAVAGIIALLRAVDEAGLTTHVVYDGRLDWQRINFKCIQVVARKLRRVTIAAA